MYRKPHFIETLVGALLAFLLFYEGTLESVTLLAMTPVMILLVMLVVNFILDVVDQLRPATA